MAEQLLTHVPKLHYTGIDRSDILLEVAQNRLAIYAEQTQFIQADLNNDTWRSQVQGQYHAILSMQSVHDLGTEPEIRRIYGIARSLLVPGGLFLNADLVVPENQPNPQSPGRLSIQRHLELLHRLDFVDVAGTLEIGSFGCCVAFVAENPTDG